MTISKRNEKEKWYFGLKQSQDLERLATHFHKNSDEQPPSPPLQGISNAKPHVVHQNR